MSPLRIQALIAQQPGRSPVAVPLHEEAVQDSIRYLSSDEATNSIDANPYWPKWDSPWWHMAALYEMGAADRIPKITAERLVSALKKQYPQDGRPADVTPCACELGNIFQILSATGIDVDRELPWISAWFVRHQMPDGGLSCDEDAYQAQPPASSLVGTIAPLEAILLFKRRPFTADEESFLDRGARCLIDRQLRRGCEAPHNLEEKADESDWLKPCFPRFYLYDVIRGLSFLLRWAEIRRQKIPAAAIHGVIESLCEKFHDGHVRVERHSFAGVGSKVPAASGEWIRTKTASHFPLLDRVSELGSVSPYLTAEWNEAKLRVGALIREGWVE